MTKVKKTHVLFVCIGNACRSPMGESIARKEASDVMEASSAGLFPLGTITSMTAKILALNGYSTAGLESKGIRGFTAEKVGLVVNMSGMAKPQALAEFAPMEEWEVADPYGEGEATYQRILQTIQGRVRELAQRLRAEQQADSGPK